jgi:small subunit ribosomal protein S16
VVRIRLKRLGRANRPFWRICAADKRAARDGRIIEELGHYDPLLGDQNKIKINRERVVYWLKLGAAPSDSVAQMLRHLGLDTKGNEVPPRPWRKKRQAPPKPAAARVAAEKAKAAEGEAPKEAPKEGAAS